MPIVGTLGFDLFCWFSYYSYFLLKETQLLKDRKKNVRKRASQGENSSITAPTGLPNQGKVSCHESRVVKDVLIDGQNIPKPGIGKGSSIHRHLNVGINRGNYKSGPSALKTARYQRKAGNLLHKFYGWHAVVCDSFSFLFILMS